MKALLVLTFAVLAFQAQASDFTISVTNESAHKMKVVAPGGGALVGPGETRDGIRFNDNGKNGLEVAGWWMNNPRQLCKIYVRWGGKVFFNGSRELRCRAH